MERNIDMKKIDCLGDICPLPLMKLQKVVPSIKAGDVYLFVTDHSCALNNIRDYCDNSSLYISSTEVINGVWEILIANKPFY